MASLNIIMNLPNDLVQQAQERGLLAPSALERLIRAELERQQRGDYFFEIADRLATLDEPPMTEEEIQAEIDAVRAEKRSDRLFELMDRLAALDIPPLTDDEVQAEVDAVRAARRAQTDRLFTTMDRLAAADKDGLTEADIQAEIDA